MQPESKYLFIGGAGFDYLEVCIKSRYWCDEFAFKFLVALMFLMAINSLMRYLTG